MLPTVNVIKCKEADFLLFSTSDYISQSLYKLGTWDEALQIITMNFLSGIANPVVMDIGANLGAYSIPIAKKILPIGGRVYAWEPQRIVFYQLCGNIVLNSLDNIFPHNQAVGEEDKIIHIPEVDYHNHWNIGAFSVEKTIRVDSNLDQYSKETTYPVHMINLNSIKEKISPDIIKIDVEGYEYNVIKGGDKFLKENLYPPIIFEVWESESFNEKRQKLLALVEELGYEISFIVQENYIAQHKSNIQLKFITMEDGSVSIIKA